MISVVVPVYNGAHVLSTTLPALAALSGVEEVLVVDDGSTDESAKLLQREERVRVVSLARNQGRAVARNSGAKHARGSVLVFFDADVAPEPYAAVALADAARRPGAVASVARLSPEATDPDEPFQDYVAHYPRGPSPTVRPGETVDWRFFLSGACAIRRSVFEAAGGFPERVSYGEDVLLGCRLASQFPMGLVLAATTVTLHDLGDLNRAQRHAHLFGEAVTRFRDACPDGMLDRLQRPGLAGRLAVAAVPVLEQTIRGLRPGPWRRRAVRYLLASTALRAARRA